MFSRGGSLLPSIYADARYIDAGIVSQAGVRGAMQQSYLLTVTRVLGNGLLRAHADESTDRWVSGDVVSNASVLISYTGPALVSHATYNWTIASTVVWDGAAGKGGVASAPATGQFRTAFLIDDADRVAATSTATNPLSNGWLTVDCPESSDTNCSNQLRSEFTLQHTQPAAGNSSDAAALSSLRVYYAAPGYAAIAVDGQSISGPDLLGPWTTWSTRILYRCYDITHLIEAPGSVGASGSTEHVVSVYLGNGQYRDHYSAVWWHPKTSGEKAPIAFTAIVMAEYADGSTAIVHSTAPSSGESKLAETGGNAAWLASTGALGANGIYAGEHFDATKVEPGWDVPGSWSPSASWSHASVLDPRTVPLASVMSVHGFAPIRIVSTEVALNVTKTPSGTYLYWFPTNAAGISELVNVVGPPGTTLTLAHAEQLKDAGGDTCLVGCFGNGITAYYPFGGAVDVYTLRGNSSNSTGQGKGGGGESWHPSFTYHGFQFVELSGWPAASAPPTVATLVKRVVHSDNAPLSAATPTFSADLLGKMHGNIVRSLTSNMHSVSVFRDPCTRVPALQRTAADRKVPPNGQRSPLVVGDPSQCTVR